jgi:hypothetical protein
VFLRKEALKMTTVFRSLIITITGLLLIVYATTAYAGEERTVKAMAPWEGQGKVFLIEPQKILFLGTYDGIMYIENDEGSLNAAVFVCPATQEVNAKDKTTKGKGHCIIKKDESNIVFAKWECSGKPGGCEGDFTLTGGTGKFEGITGSGKVIVRTALVGIAANLSSGDVVKSAAGLAVWPELRYKIP